jgi:hypothetical protein
MAKEFKTVCSVDNPVTSKLFGVDLDKQIKEIADARRVSKKVVQNYGDRNSRYSPYDRYKSTYPNSGQSVYYNYETCVLTSQNVVAYIDDCLLQGDSCDSCIKNVNQTVKILDNLGLTIHPTKSVFQPSKQIVYLGFILYSEKMTVSLTPEKANDITDSLDCYAKSLKRH